jgi:hypothetical protein
VAIVDVDRLNRHLGSPRWSDDQSEEAADLLDEVEDGLASALNTKISPVPYVETCPVLASGLVLTKYHVYSVSRVGDAAAGSDGTPPSGWLLQDHWLRMDTASSSGPAPSLGFGLSAPSVASIGMINVRYQAGLGNVPALRRAILKRTGIIFNNRHDDTVVVRDLEAAEPVRLGPEEWSDEELDALSVFRIVRVTR